MLHESMVLHEIVSESNSSVDRTPVFKRYRRTEKEYLSFSLIYQNGKRSLDLICKDNAEGYKSSSTSLLN
nr:E3 ubiquitin-protein ligase HERC2 [Tanacetum cinerariifolium]